MLNTRIFTALTLCLCVSASVWLAPGLSQTPLQPRWEQVGQIKFVVLNTITPHNGWLFTWTGTGVWRSYDQGTNWEELTEGLPDRPRSVLGIASASGKLFAYVNRYLYHSDTDGEFWDKVEDSSFVLTPPSLSTMVNRGGKLLMAGARGSIYQSTDEGQSWKLLYRRLGDATINALTQAGGKLMAATNQGVWLSTDDGETWREPTEQVGYWVPGKVTITAAEQVTALTALGNRLFAATWGGGVFRSEDAGETWQPVNEGLEWEETDDPLFVKTLMPAAPAGRRLLAGTRLGVFALRQALGHALRQPVHGVPAH